ncbi:MAG TPA: hypothetical protein PLA92_09500 [Fimbriimonadaceae bacterium]|nr:hypothetical protein [Fimbriimonadaceae bacterium]
MPSRTRIVCLHEGKKGRSIDPLFITKLLKTLDPTWIRPWDGSNVVRTVDCGGRSELIRRMPSELETCNAVGSDTTLMVWADLDHDAGTPDNLREKFWKEARSAGISKADFDKVVFVFAKDRLENWIEYLEAGKTDEAKEGTRVKKPKQASDAAKQLAKRCKGEKGPNLPPSLEWSCQNWRALCQRMG